MLNVLYTLLLKNHPDNKRGSMFNVGMSGKNFENLIIQINFTTVTLSGYWCPGKQVAHGPLVSSRGFFSSY